MINTVQSVTSAAAGPAGAASRTASGGGNRKASTASLTAAAAALPPSPAGSSSSGAFVMRASSSGLVIPTPEVFTDEADHYADLYKGGYRLPKQYIHVQPFAVDEELPDYDLDEEDLEFVEKRLRAEKKFDVDLLTVEDMLDRLERNSDHSVVSAKEARMLLKEGDDLILAVYDYWVDKRLRLKRPLAPKVKRDTRIPSSAGPEPAPSGGGSTNPYVAFRRRTEKMQTRKNRKNDEVSYEKMLKLRRDLNRAVTLLEMVKRREKAKQDKLEVTAAIFRERHAEGDWEGKVVFEALQRRAREQQRAFQNLAWMNQLTPATMAAAAAAQGLAFLGGDAAAAASAAAVARQKRQHVKKKAKSKMALSKRNMLAETNGPCFGTDFISDDEDSGGGGLSGSSSQAAADHLDDLRDLERFNPGAPVFFRRKRNCQYLAPAVDELGDPEPRAWPWDSPFDGGGGGGEPRYRHSLASLSTPAPRCVGLVRRRMGRGGRIVLDRASVPGADDQLWRSLDFTVINGIGGGAGSTAGEDEESNSNSLSDWPHFRPVTPPHCQEDEERLQFPPAAAAAAALSRQVTAAGAALQVEVKLASY